MSAPYSICYADPAWKYSDQQQNRPSNYARMRLENIKAMRVGSIMARNAVLFLWATTPLFPEALQVVTAWGFQYITIGFAWIKRYRSGDPQVGMGHYTRANIEPVILAERGRGLRRISKSVRQVVETIPSRLHSEKPHDVRDRIVELYGDVPRIELFARHKVNGWDRWGNQAPRGPGYQPMGIL